MVTCTELGFAHTPWIGVTEGCSKLDADKGRDMKKDECTLNFDDGDDINEDERKLDGHILELKE